MNHSSSLDTQPPTRLLVCEGRCNPVLPAWDAARDDRRWGALRLRPVLTHTLHGLARGMSYTGVSVWICRICGARKEQ